MDFPEFLLMMTMKYQTENAEDEIREAFKDCGEISDVRLVRDSSTGIGKGFGYVNFADRDSVETALSLNGTKVSANF